MTDTVLVPPCGGILRRALSRLAARRARRRSRIIDRQAFQTMLAMDDMLLWDIGVTRDEVIRASRLPQEQNAARELRRYAQRRRRAQKWPQSPARQA